MRSDSCEICGSAENIEELSVQLTIDEDRLISNRITVCMRCFVLCPDSRLLLLQVQENRLKELSEDDEQEQEELEF